MNRRNFLRTSLGAGSAVSLGMGASMASFNDAEASAEDYRALICINLAGGNDGMNMVIPFDDVHYNEYAALRTTLALSKSSLSQLSNEYALHGSMSTLQPAWQEGAMAVLHNIGTLSRPVTKDQFWAWWGHSDNTYVPDGIQSHPGSGALWQTGGSDCRWQTSVNVGATASGWAAKALAQLNARSLISVAGSPLLGVTAGAFPLTVPGAPSNPGYVTGHYSLPAFADSARYAALQQMAQLSAAADHPMYRAFASGQKQDIDYNAAMGPVIASSMSDAANSQINAPFLAVAGLDSYNMINQMFQIAKIIKARNVIGGNRHVFYAELPAFDTHGAQLAQHASYLGAVAAAMSALHASMKSLGIEKNVTSFTVSDFGRTFAANGSAGSDHGWGSEHIVVGGAVDGGKFYGTYPRLVLGGPDDMYNAGQWVPTLGHDQYTATLVKWFDPSINLDAIFTNLKNFPVRDLGFMKA